MSHNLQRWKLFYCWSLILFLLQCGVLLWKPDELLYVVCTWKVFKLWIFKLLCSKCWLLRRGSGFIKSMPVYVSGRPVFNRRRNGVCTNFRRMLRPSR